MSDQKAVAKPGEAAAPAKASAAPARKKRKESPVYKFYVTKADKVERLRKECPRCGRGVFLGEHKDRLTCGKCGYTSFKKK
jgi:ubiquitin-small subunit ribosomal protein S27Ae